MINSPIKDDFSLFLQKGAFYIALAVAIIIVLTIGVYMCFVFKKKNEPKYNFNLESFYLSLGGKENVTIESATGSRLVVSLKNRELLNSTAVRELGVSNIIQMQDKIVLVLPKELIQEILTNI